MNKASFAFGMVLVLITPASQAASHEQMQPMETSAHSGEQAMHQGSGVIKGFKPGKIQIAHQAITSLGWPAMTMWFEWQGEEADLKIGQKVNFTLESKDGKKWSIREIHALTDIPKR